MSDEVPLVRVWAPIAKCECGEDLPVSLENVEVARRFKWFPVNRRFSRLFYVLLKAEGVPQGVSNGAIVYLTQHRKHLGLDKQQIRGVWGLQCGVFGAGGDFLPSKIKGKEAEIVLLMDEELSELDANGRLGRSFTESDWPSIVADALGFQSGKPVQAGIDDEFTWIASRKGEWPNFATAPSVVAIKEWLDINKPGNDALSRDFWNLMWSRRLAPGDKKIKKSAFKEDEGPQDNKHDEELEKRLFGEA